MAKLVFGMNQSLDGYVDHMAFGPSPRPTRSGFSKCTRRWGMLALRARNSLSASQLNARVRHHGGTIREEKDVPDIVVLPPVLVGGALLLGLAIHFFVWQVEPIPLVLARVLGLTVFVAGGVLALSRTWP